jgi:outer membrane protein assembly factor BamA
MNGWGLCSWFLFALMVLFSTRMEAQRKSDRSHAEHLYFGYPVVFYSPETRLGFGASGFYGFRADTTDTLTPVSTIQMGAMYTLNRQFIFTVPFQLFSKARKHTLYGEFTLNRFFYNFYGAGFALPAVTEERYEVQFPRIRLHYLRRLSEHWYAGARYWAEHQRILETKEDGLLDSGTIPGGNGGRSAGPGLVVQFDARNNVISSRSGQYIELSWHHQSNHTGSDYFFDRVRLDTRTFHPLGQRGTLALMAMGERLTGSPPFFSMASLGSDRRMRGYYDGYFRDHSLGLVQGEYRHRVWKMISAVAFASAGWMDASFRTFTLPNTIWTAGAGARFMLDPSSRVTLRLDYAIGQYSDAVYFTMGEAF